MILHPVVYARPGVRRLSEAGRAGRPGLGTITLTVEELALIERLGFNTPGHFVRQALDFVVQLPED